MLTFEGAKGHGGQVSSQPPHFVIGYRVECRWDMPRGVIPLSARDSTSHDQSRRLAGRLSILHLGQHGSDKSPLAASRALMPSAPFQENQRFQNTGFKHKCCILGLQAAPGPGRPSRKGEGFAPRFSGGSPGPPRAFRYLKIPDLC